MQVLGIDQINAARRAAPIAALQHVEQIKVVVIGAGQAGLTVGYHLRRRQIPFVILDAAPRIGDAWRKRWDSLRLFTPAGYDGLDGFRFPASSRDFPSKDAMADYLEAYARRFDLPVRLNTRVDSLGRTADGYVVTANGRRIEAEHVIVAMANYQHPRIPDFAGDLDPGIVQLHSSAYRNPAQLQPGGVLVVGAGNSGAEIALDVARGRKTYLSGRDVGHVPFRIEGFLGRHLLSHLVLRLAFHHLLTASTPFGRKARPKMLHRAAPLIRTRPHELEAAGIERVGRTTGFINGKPVLGDGRSLDVANVVWCTGYHPGFDWVHLPVFDAAGDPVHSRGVVTGQPGLYFLGLNFLYAMSSTMIQGVGRDARHIAETISDRVRLG